MAYIAAMDRQRGFTLVEAMVVLAIAAILATAALPAFDAMVKNNRRVTAVNDFVTSLHIARSEAITRNQRITLCPSTDGAVCAVSPDGWESGWLIFTDLDGDGLIDTVDGDEILYTGEPLSGDLRLVSSEFTDNLVYSPNGRARSGTTTSGTMLLCDAGVEDPSRAVIINMTGRPRVTHETSATCPS